VNAHALGEVIDALPAIAVAVSGGVDSLTLMAFAHDRRGGAGVQAVHAASPAVPPASSARVQELARARGWRLSLIDAGETNDPAYLANPVDRCRVCKSHLYDAMAAIVAHASTSKAARPVIVSGTNMNDLDDYRPGLDAARARDVRHPFVDAGMDKDDVRALARSLGLGDVAELPAQPCLSSRVETGVAIHASTLRAVDDVERAMRRALGAAVTVRCRVRREGMVLEVDERVLDSLGERERAQLLSLAPRASLAPYRMGSAFLRVLG
jgi:uncharacterized protein